MTTVTQTAYLALGANLPSEAGTPADQIRLSFDWLDAAPHIDLVARSHLYASAPVGVLDQPEFVNAACKIETVLDPLALLDFCQSLEARAKRVRRIHWGPRTLDVDIIAYANAPFAHPRLTLPHPLWHTRSFVLTPLAEVEPNLVLESMHIQTLLDKCNDIPRRLP